MIAWRSLEGHLWTILPALRHAVVPLALPSWRPWHSWIHSNDRPVRVSGRLHGKPQADTVVVVVHGLGGNVDSHYCARAARAIDARGWSCLRLALRGSDDDIDDFYHAGLTADLETALASAEIERHERIFILGYSLGGHVALRLVCGQSDTRVAGIATICAPLDLTLGSRAIDGRGAWLYRRNILNGLKAQYARIAARAPAPSPVAQACSVRFIRDWDALTVVPRFGFADVDDYYLRESVCSRLDKLRRPALLVFSRHDPVVPAWTVTPALEKTSSFAEVRWIDVGGHVGFPSRRRGRAVEIAVLDWLDRCPSRTEQ